MALLSLSFLGSFRAHLENSHSIKFRTRKVQALVIYIATEPGRHPRERLLDLLWPGMPERSARHNLRQALYYLRSDLPAIQARERGSNGTVPLVIANRQTIRMNPDAAVTVDSLELEALVDVIKAHDHPDLLSCPVCRDKLEQAVALYRGDFLADFYLDDSNEFEDWAQAKREFFRRKALDALEILTAIATRKKEYPLARTLAERQLEIDNLRESSCRQLMEILALSGHREEALAVYESCRQLLAVELSMEPARRTTETYEKVLAGDLSFDTPYTHGVRGFDLKEEIGGGVYGSVHRALQPSINREVAVKIIRAKYANSAEFIRRFEDEAQTIARLEHPYVIPLYDYWRDPDGVYLVMRYLRGGNLLTALDDGPWELDRAITMVEQIASALEAAHRLGIVHRDIKPANILLDEEGNAYLSDFSIALELRGGRLLDAPGVITGTPEYISPEQILDEQVGPQSDLYSLGAVLFETLTGERPFGEAPVANLLHKHLHEPFPLVSAIRPDVPASIDAIIQMATAKRPADRYADALEMAAALRSAGIGDGVTETLSVPALAATGVPLYNPYKGLGAFQERDAEDFFGRDALVDRLVARLALAPSSPGESGPGAKGRFLALVGPSGSGKSSVVKAGLIPALRSGAIPSSEKWFVAEMVPGTHPLEELEMALWPIAVDAPPSLVEPMQRDVRGMMRTIRRIMPNEEGAQLLLVIDQFEELFTLVEDEERRTFFLESLISAISAQRSPLRVVITLRADFYDRPLQLQSLGRLLKESTEVILPLVPEELTWAVREPARRVGVSMETGLAESIVADVADQPGALPLLQYALTELFERRQGNQMTRAAYREIGGVEGALGRRADELFAGLDTEAQAASRHLFLRLITLGEGVEDTRRRVLRSELEAIDDSLLPDVIDAYGEARLVTFDRDPLSRAATVEVAHEALLREWALLRRWLEESRDEVRLQQQLARAAADWQAAGQDESYLLRGARLAQFEGWTDGNNIALTVGESAFLAESWAAREVREAEKEARRQRELESARQLAETEKARSEEQAGAARRLRQRAFMLAGLLILALVLAVAAVLFGRDASRNADLAATREAEAVVAAQAEATAAAEALGQQAIAEQERATAEEQTLVAQSRELAAASSNKLDTDLELSLLLAVQALSKAETNEALQALHSVLITSRVRQHLAGHESPIQRTAYAPDGSLIAVGAHDEELATIWDAASGRKLHEIPVAGCCWGLYFDDDGKRLAAVEPGESFSLAIWDVTIGEKIESFPLPLASSGIGHYYLSPDWSQVAIFFWDDTPAVWDLLKGEQRFELPGHTGEFVELEYSKDGTRLVTYDADGVVIVWDAASGELRRRIETGWPIDDHALSPDGSLVALATGDGWGEVHVWKLDENAEDDEFAPIAKMRGHVGEILVLAFSPDGRQVASASRDGTARLWDISSGRELLVLPHPTMVRSVVFHPDGNSLLTGDTEGVARLWDITPQGVAEKMTLAAHDSNVMNAALSPDEEYLATASWDGTARIWDLDSGEMLELTHDEGEIVTSVAYHPDGRRVATAGTGGSVRVWDPDMGAELLRLEGHGEGIVGGFFPGVLGVAYTPDGKRLASVGADQTIRFWDSESGEALSLIEGHSVGIASLAFSPDGRYLATGGGDIADASIRIWDADTGQERIAIPPSHFDRVWGLDFSPDGRLLASSGRDTTAKIWALDYEAGTAELLATLTGHTSTVFRTRFSPDGRRLATASPRDREVRLWDLEELYAGAEAASVSELLVLPGGAALVFGRSGSELITAGDDRLLRVYLLDGGELLALAESRLTRPLTEVECRRYLHVDTCPEAP